MKQLTAMMLSIVMIFVLTACGSARISGEAYPEDIITEDFKIPLGDTGAKIAIPAEVGFESYDSELNDFYGGGPSGEWRIIVNTEPKSDYPDCTLADYAALSAQANEGTLAQDAQGNYYFTYTNQHSAEDVYTFYTSVREDAEKYYRIALYCFSDAWDVYCEQFAEWAATIEVE